MKKNRSRSRSIAKVDGLHRRIESTATASNKRQRFEPTEVFFAWLLSLPSRANIAQAAQKAITVLEDAGPLCPQGLELRRLLREAAHCANRSATTRSPKGSRSRKRLVH